MKLKIFDNLVQTRYETLIKNIKSNSNSFYDSYLDLLEGTIKFILDSSEISYNKSSTCGNILKEKDVNEFLLRKLFLDDYTINKLPDYIKKCNDHKHKKEKKLSIDSIINYLRVYFNLINYYYNFINEEKIIYDENYFISIFKEFEIINSEYKNEIIVLKNEITSLYKQQKITDVEYDNYEKLLSIKEIEKYNLEEQNKILENQLRILTDIHNNRIIEEKIEKIEKQNVELIQRIKNFEKNEIRNTESTNKENLFNFIKRSQKYYIWAEDNLSSYKKIVLYSGVFSILLSIIITLISIINYKFYSTYAFFENIYCFFIIAIIIDNEKMKKTINHVDLANASTFKYNLNSYLLYCTHDKEKKVYKIFRVLAYVSSIMSSIVIFELKLICILIILLEILYFSSILVNSIYKKKIHIGYGYFVKYVGKQLQGNDIVSIVYVTFENKYYPYDDFLNKYGNVKND